MFFEGEGFASFAKVRKDKGGRDPISDGPDTKTTFYNKVGVFVRKKEAQSLLSSSSVICDRVFH